MKKRDVTALVGPVWDRVSAALDLGSWKVSFTVTKSKHNPDLVLYVESIMSVTTSHFGVREARITVNADRISDLRALQSGLLHEGIHLCASPLERFVTAVERSSHSNALIREVYREFDEEFTENLERALMPLVFPQGAS